MPLRVDDEAGLSSPLPNRTTSIWSICSSNSSFALLHPTPTSNDSPHLSPTSSRSTSTFSSRSSSSFYTHCSSSEATTASIAPPPPPPGDPPSNHQLAYQQRITANWRARVAYERTHGVPHGPPPKANGEFGVWMRVDHSPPDPNVDGNAPPPPVHHAPLPSNSSAPVIVKYPPTNFNAAIKAPPPKPAPVNASIPEPAGPKPMGPKATGIYAKAPPIQAIPPSDFHPFFNHSPHGSTVPPSLFFVEHPPHEMDIPSSSFFVHGIARPMGYNIPPTNLLLVPGSTNSDDGDGEHDVNHGTWFDC